MSQTTIIDNGTHRAIVSDHDEQVYLNVGRDGGGEAMFMNPVHALEAGTALIRAAAAAIERQFQRQLGSP